MNSAFAANNDAQMVLRSGVTKNGDKHRAAYKIRQRTL